MLGLTQIIFWDFYFLLFKARMEVEDLFVDLADGKKLLKLLEIISGEKLSKPNNGRMRVHKIENVNKSLAFLHTKVYSVIRKITKKKKNPFVHPPIPFYLEAISLKWSVLMIRDSNFVVPNSAQLIFAQAQQHLVRYIMTTFFLLSIFSLCNSDRCHQNVMFNWCYSTAVYCLIIWNG